MPVVAVLAVLAFPGAASAAPPEPFGHACEPRNGVLFCPTRTLADRVPTFDGAPLDVDVTLPLGTEAGEPLPTIVMMHGYGGSKESFESDSPEGSGGTTYHYNNTYYAQRGYAVVNYTARGFGRSCGKAEGSAGTPQCLATKSYIHLADQRWEARDTQHLLGLLVDQGVTNPDAMGVTGISYGGGQSIELALLDDRIRTMDGGYAAWQSPDGTSLSIAAAYPRWPWSDLVDSLLPNGRFLDSGVAGRFESREPLGIMKQSYVNGLYALGQTSGTYCGSPPRPPVCTDQTADINFWFTRVTAGEPYTADARAIADEIYGFHQGYGIDVEDPAPLLLQSGWTDDLFPPKESIRIYNALRGRTPVSMQFGDLGHARGSNKPNADRHFNDAGSAFFDEHLMGTTSGRAPAGGQVTAFTQTCPRSAPAGGPFVASSYADLARGSVRFGSDESQTVLSTGGDPATSAAIDPIAGGGDACREVAAETAPGTAVVLGPRVRRGYLLLGLPTVTADIRTTGPFGQLDSRLWDVAPDGQQRLVSRGAYRLELNQTGEVVFQLHGNGYCFEPGHRPKLELVGSDADFLRPSNSAFAVEVADVEVELPIEARRPRGCAVERPGDEGRDEEDGDDDGRDDDDEGRDDDSDDDSGNDGDDSGNDGDDSGNDGDDSED
ncbi:MAG: CocE/NonD family hydrolase [Thermoleophilaceae bacterium]